MAHQIVKGLLIFSALLFSITLSPVNAQTVTGSGTTNILPKFTDVSAIGNSSIFDNGNVGIGTSSPLGFFSVGSSNIIPDLLVTSGGNVSIGSTAAAAKLDIAGTVRVQSVNSGATTSACFDGNNILSTCSASSALSGSGVNNYVTKWNGGYSLSYGTIFDNGNVGIGTSSTTQKLTVAGNIKIADNNAMILGSGTTPPTGATAGSMYYDAALGKFRCWEGSGWINCIGSGSSQWTTTGSNISYDSGNVGVGTTAPGYKVEVAGDISAPVYRDRNNPTSYYLDPSGTSQMNTIGGHTVSGTLSMGNQSIDNINTLHGVSNQPLRIKSLGSGGVFLNDNSGTTGSFAWYGGGGTQLIVFTSGGNVGIGITAPTARLQVNGSNQNIIVANASSGYGAVDLQSAGTSKLSLGYAGSNGNYGAQTIAGDVSIKANNTNIHFVTGSGNAATSMYISSSGSVGVGRTAPGEKLDIGTGNGRVESGYNWLTTSDLKFKTNISELKGSLSKIIKLRGVRYDLKTDNNINRGEGKNIGFIAQELENQYPELVETDRSGTKSVSYDKMTAILLEAIKEQQKQIDSLRKEVKRLKK